jgi:hypothetical protein
MTESNQVPPWAAMAEAWELHRAHVRIPDALEAPEDAAPPVEDAYSAARDLYADLAVAGDAGARLDDLGAWSMADERREAALEVLLGSGLVEETEEAPRGGGPLETVLRVRGGGL